MSTPEFVHLHVHSMFSLLDGVGSFSPLFQTVEKMGMPAVALTDHGNLFGAYAFYQESLNHDAVRPIIGSELYVSPTSHTDRQSPQVRETGSNQHLVLLAKDEVGYYNLCRLVSTAFIDGFYRRPRIDKELLAQHHEGLIGMSACLAGVVCNYLNKGREKDALQNADDYAQIFGPDHFYIEIMDHGLPDQKKCNKQLLDIAKKLNLPIVATNDAHYLKNTDSKTQDMLIAIGTGKTLDDQGRFTFEGDQFYLKSPEEMEKLFGHIPGALSNTLKVAEMCDVKIEKKNDLLPEFPPPDDLTDEQYLRQLVEEGLRERYGEINDDIRERYEHEMHIITTMGFVSYFLVVWDFVNYARDQGIPTGCRGSGAGSIVAYALNITELDPIKYKLFFERFLNPERVSMPDFDIDICQARRGEVMEYVRQKYGEANVANIITFGTMKAKAAVRDVGRVTGMPLDRVDTIAKMIPGGPKVTIDSALEDSPELKDLYEADPQVADLIDRARKVEGAIRQPGMHAAGVVVCRKPLIDAIPLYCQAGKGEILTQYNMIEVEELGFLKIDFLGLKTLTVVADCLQQIRENHGVEIDWAEVGFTDEATFGVLQRGEGFGVFQVESSGMRDMLRRAAPSNLEDIIALIALYRPGPLQFMDTFINRKHGREEVTYPHPDMKQALQETYGLMIYQEQVMQVAAILAGFSLGQADILRRAMSKKKEKEMAKMKVEFMKGCAEKGVSEAVGEEVFATIKQFASYGFNKAHAASYAVLTFRTAYLKAHYPAEFMSALLTGEIRTGASDELGKYVGVARDMGLSVLQPDVNESGDFFRVVDGDIRFGLAAIKNVGHGAVAHILEAREKGGPFESFQDFCERIDSHTVNARAVEFLIRASAFDALEGSRPQKLAILEDALEMGAELRRQRESGQTSLFDMLGDDDASAAVNQVSFPDIPDWTDREKLDSEKELAGFFLSGHPLDAFRADIRSFTTVESSDLAETENDSKVCMVGMITMAKEIQTKKGDRMAFVELEDFEGKYEATFFPRTYEEVRDILREGAVVFIEGKRSMRPNIDEEPKVLVDRAQRIEDLRRSRTRYVDITLRTDRVDNRALEGLRTVIRHHKGGTPIRLHLLGHADEEVMVEADSRFKINPSDAFLKEFDKLDFKQTLRFAAE